MYWLGASCDPSRHHTGMDLCTLALVRRVEIVIRQPPFFFLEPGWVRGETIPEHLDLDGGSAATAGSPLRSAGETLRKQVWATKSSRFGAHKRLTALNSWSTWTVAALTIYLIVTSLLLGTSVLSLSDEAKELGLFLSIGITVLVLVLSLTEAARDYPLRADRLHRCAMELGGLWTRIDMALAGDDEEIEAPLQLLGAEYHRILLDSAENHDEIDFRWFRAHHPHEFGMTAFGAQLLRGWYAARTFGPYVVGVVAPLLLLAWFILTYLPK